MIATAASPRALAPNEGLRLEAGPGRDSHLQGHARGHPRRDRLLRLRGRARRAAAARASRPGRDAPRPGQPLQGQSGRARAPPASRRLRLHAKGPASRIPQCDRPTGRADHRVRARRWAHRRRQRDAIGVDTFILGLRDSYDAQCDPGPQPARFEVRVGEDAFDFAFNAPSLAVQRGSSPTSTSVVTVDPNEMAAVASGEIPLLAALSPANTAEDDAAWRAFAERFPIPAGHAHLRGVRGRPAGSRGA